MRVYPRFDPLHSPDLELIGRCFAEDASRKFGLRTYDKFLKLTGAVLDGARQPRELKISPDATQVKSTLFQ